MDYQGFLLLDIIVQNIDVKRVLGDGVVSCDEIVNLMLVNRTWKSILGKQLKEYMRTMYRNKHSEFLGYIKHVYNIEDSFLHPFKFSNYLKAIDFVRTKTKGQRWRHLFKDIMNSSLLVHLEMKDCCNKQVVDRYVVNTMHILLVTSDYIREKVCANGNKVNDVPILVWHVYVLFDFIRLICKYHKNTTILNNKRIVETIKYKIEDFKRDERYLQSAGSEIGYRTMRLLEVVNADLAV